MWNGIHINVKIIKIVAKWTICVILDKGKRGGAWDFKGEIGKLIGSWDSDKKLLIGNSEKMGQREI